MDEISAAARRAEEVAHSAKEQAQRAMTLLEAHLNECNRNSAALLLAVRESVTSSAEGREKIYERLQVTGQDLAVLHDQMKGMKRLIWSGGGSALGTFIVGLLLLVWFFVQRDVIPPEGRQYAPIPYTSPFIKPGPHP